jgi:hypothetical protein
MTYILYNPDRSIKTFMDTIDDVVLAEGETWAYIDQSFEEYAARFVLSHGGNTCLNVYAKVGDAELLIDIRAPGNESVSVDVNGQAQEVALTEGKGSIHIPTDAAGAYFLAPTDRQNFCAAGCGSLLVTVQESTGG